MSSRTEGCSLLELSVAIIVIAILAAGLSSLTTSSGTGFTEVSSDVSETADIRRTLDRIVDELRLSYPNTVRTIDTQHLEFATIEGWSHSTSQVTSIHVAEFVAGELRLDGTVLAAGLDDVAFDYDGRVLQIAIQVTRGQEPTIVSTKVRI